MQMRGAVHMGIQEILLLVVDKISLGSVWEIRIGELRHKLLLLHWNKWLLLSLGILILIVQMETL